MSEGEEGADPPAGVGRLDEGTAGVAAATLRGAG